MKESSECLLWQGDNKEAEGRQSVGGRNGDQYTMMVKEGKKKPQEEKQTEVEKHEGVTEREKEQKMDTI